MEPITSQVLNSYYLNKAQHLELKCQSFAYLVGSRERRASVHVVLRLDNVHHLVGVELKHAFHFGVLRTIGGFLRCFTRLSHLYVLPSLALPDPSEVPGEQNGKTLH